MLVLISIRRLASRNAIFAIYFSTSCESVTSSCSIFFYSVVSTNRIRKLFNKSLVVAFVNEIVLGKRGRLRKI